MILKVEMKQKHWSSIIFSLVLHISFLAFFMLVIQRRENDLQRESKKREDIPDYQISLQSISIEDYKRLVGDKNSSKSSENKPNQKSNQTSDTLIIKNTPSELAKSSDKLVLEGNVEKKMLVKQKEEDSQEKSQPKISPKPNLEETKEKSFKVKKNLQSEDNVIKQKPEPINRKTMILKVTKRPMLGRVVNNPNGFSINIDNRSIDKGIKNVVKTEKSITNTDEADIEIQKVSENIKQESIKQESVKKPQEVEKDEKPKKIDIKKIEEERMPDLDVLDDNDEGIISSIKDVFSGKPSSSEKYKKDVIARHMITLQMMRCWQNYKSHSNRKNTYASVDVVLDKNGTIVSITPVKKIFTDRKEEFLYNRMLKDVELALYECSPLRDLPETDHKTWSKVKFNFFYN